MTMLARLCLALAAFLLPAGCAVAENALTGGKSDCRYEVPDGWLPKDVRWSGACHEGTADGHGVLREFSGTQVSRIFFGMLGRGKLRIGVIQQSDGFKAGRFDAGKIVDDGDRNALIKAFDEAATAAKQVSETYRREGNTASARFYLDKSKQLAEQMD